MVASVNSIDVANASYGNVSRMGRLNNGRMAYRVIDSKGESAGVVSVPEEQVDRFEYSYKRIINSAKEIDNYVNTHSTPEDIKRRKRLSVISLAGGGILGGAIPLFLTRNSSVLKQIFSTALGLFTGLMAGLALSLKLNTPKGSYEFSQAKEAILDLDIRLEKEENKNKILKA